MVEDTTVRVDALRAGDVIQLNEEPQTLVICAIADPIGLLRLVDLADGLTGASLGRRALRVDQQVARLAEPAGLHLLVHRGVEPQTIEVAGRERVVDPGRFVSWIAMADVTVSHDATWEHRVVPVATDRLTRPGWQTLRRASRPAVAPREAVVPV